MKALAELGISPAPWRCCGLFIMDAHQSLDGSYIGEVAKVCDCGVYSFESHDANARLIAAAPELYEDLAEACREFCFRCTHKDDNDAADICDQCIVSGWKETLAKAGGEEVA